MGDVLRELLPRKARLWLYLIVAAGMAGLTAWQAAQGDWTAFALSLGGTFAPLLAAGNVAPAPEEATP